MFARPIPGCSSGSTAIPANAAIPQISGQANFGSVLGASTGRWSGIPINYSYHWYRCNSNGSGCSVINGAKSANYAILAHADVGSTLSVAVTASNASGSTTVSSNPSSVVTTVAPPFNVTSTATDGATLRGSVVWQATPAISVTFVEFYIDGVLVQTDTSAPYVYNNATTGKLDTTTLANGTHVLGVLALYTNNETYSFYGATVTVANQIAPPTPSSTPSPMPSPISSLLPTATPKHHGHR